MPGPRRHVGGIVNATPTPLRDLSVTLGGMRLPNPVMTASGCAANGRELHRFFDITELGAFVTKTVMGLPRAGRGTPRMAETPSGMLNSIGLQGPGIDAFVDHDLPWLRSVGARVLVSVAGETPEEFGLVTRVLRNSAAFEAVIGVEVNISCPNVANRGLVFACDPESTAAVLTEVRKELPPHVPVFAKLSPDVTDVVAIAMAAVGAGANGLTAINTTLGMAIDTQRLRPVLAGVTGGLSGPAVLPIAVRAVWQVYAAMRAGVLPSVPIIGVGGIRGGSDALQLLAAGASAVQVGTATFNDPSAALRVRDELAFELGRHGFGAVADVVGIAHDRVPPRVGTSADPAATGGAEPDPGPTSHAPTDPAATSGTGAGAGEPGTGARAGRTDRGDSGTDRGDRGDSGASGTHRGGDSGTVPAARTPQERS